MKKAVIVSAVRTPIGKMNGSLSSFSATTLGGFVLTELLNRANIPASEVNEVILGNVLPHGLGQNPARQACFEAQLPYEVEALTINKVCGSGLKSIMLAAQAIASGDADVVLAGGMENMSQAPYILDKARSGYRMGHGSLIDAMIRDGLWDIRNDLHMGETAELVSKKYKVSREDMDRFSENSYKKALLAESEGWLSQERMAISVPQRKKDPILFQQDEILRPTSFEQLSQLRTAFQKDGSVTAGNASKIADGAAGVLLTSEEYAKGHNLPILAYVRSQASAGIEPLDVLVAPIKSIPKVLKKAQLNISDIDLFEINEAFASSSVAVQRTLEIPEEKVNVHGGSIALGHPIGASGARVLVTLLYAMLQKEKQRGLASLCLGGGEAVSLIIERS